MSNIDSSSAWGQVIPTLTPVAESDKPRSQSIPPLGAPKKAQASIPTLQPSTRGGRPLKALVEPPVASTKPAVNVIPPLGAPTTLQEVTRNALKGETGKDNPGDEKSSTEPPVTLIIPELVPGVKPKVEPIKLKDPYSQFFLILAKQVDSEDIFLLDTMSYLQYEKMGKAGSEHFESYFIRKMKSHIQYKSGVAGYFDRSGHLRQTAVGISNSEIKKGVVCKHAISDDGKPSAKEILYYRDRNPGTRLDENEIIGTIRQPAQIVGTFIGVLFDSGLDLEKGLVLSELFEN